MPSQIYNTAGNAAFSVGQQLGDGWYNCAASAATTTSSNLNNAYVIWNDWNTQYVITSVVTTNVINAEAWPVWVNQQQLSAQQLAERAAEAVLHEQRIAVANAQRRQAQVRARHLLGSLLSKAQAESLKDRNYFDLEVTARDGAVKRYRIHKGRSGNVELLAPDGTPLRRYCAHPLLYVPDEDTMLSQKLMLESDEEQFLRTANVHPVPRVA